MSNLLRPPTTIERYFSLHYAVFHAKRTSPVIPCVSEDARTKPVGMDTCVARHHNGICVICVSQQHPIVTESKQVTKVEYRVPFQQVRGKRKRGGIRVEPLTRLCMLTCDSGEVFTVQTGVKGIIVEYNDNLQKSPSLITDKPLTDGYLAIVLPFPSEIRNAVDKLMTESSYKNHFKEPVIQSDNV